MAICITRAGGLILGNLIVAEASMGGDGLLFECSVGLYTAGPALTPGMVLADFTAADFTGYAPILAQTWGAPFIDADANLQLNSPVQQFVCTGTGVFDPVIGYYVWREGTPDVLLFADRFSTPISLALLGDGVAFTISMEFVLTGHGTYLFSP